MSSLLALPAEVRSKVFALVVTPSRNYAGLPHDKAGCKPSELLKTLITNARLINRVFFEQVLRAYFHETQLKAVLYDTHFVPGFEDIPTTVIRHGTFEQHHIFEANFVKLKVCTMCIWHKSNMERFVRKVEEIAKACVSLTELTVSLDEVRMV